MIPSPNHTPSQLQNHRYILLAYPSIRSKDGIYTIPEQVGPEFSGRMIGIHKGFITGVYADGAFIKWFVESKGAQQLGTKYDKFYNWNEAVIYVKTGEYVPRIRDCLGDVPLDPPIQYIRPEYDFESSLLAGTLLIAHHESVMMPYTGPITRPSTIQIEILNSSKFGSQANSSRGLPVPPPWRMLTPDTILHAPPAPSTIASPPRSPSFSPEPSFSGRSHSPTGLAVPKPLRRARSTDIFLQTAVPHGVVPQFSVPSPAPATQAPEHSIESEVSYRLKVLDAMCRFDPATEAEIDEEMTLRVISACSNSAYWRRTMILAALHGAANSS
ncbi:hypothetical protein CTheo_5705 [Ceratobasidium theobromae]|uniref:Uncharacterized protein n=1 Tax=Ceratobasidium theobromae TaxID=1582974 RepID=A0A5N5QGH8_9AGAM|nr:hypothetical protein CTheo_5705 [Ceratobasidium theobromae]